MDWHSVGMNPEVIRVCSRYQAPLCILYFVGDAQSDDSEARKQGEVGGTATATHRQVGD